MGLPGGGDRPACRSSAVSRDLRSAGGGDRLAPLLGEGGGLEGGLPRPCWNSAAERAERLAGGAAVVGAVLLAVAAAAQWGAGAARNQPWVP